MKKYIAFIGGQCSQIITKEEAQAWAAKFLANNQKHPSVFIAEVIETAERASNPVITKSFFVQTDEPATKEKAA